MNFRPVGSLKGRTAEDPMSELSAKARDKLPAKDFAEPDKRAYPIEDNPMPGTPRLAPARP